MATITVTCNGNAITVTDNDITQTSISINNNETCQSFAEVRRVSWLAFTNGVWNTPSVSGTDEIPAKQTGKTRRTKGGHSL